MKCYIEDKAYKKFRYYIDNTESEISGMGKSRVENGDIYIEDFVILEQTNTSSSTEFEADDWAKFAHKIKKEGQDLKDWNVWWHSHYNFETFWSKTDDECIESFNDIPLLISIVGNQDCDILTRIDTDVTNDELGIKSRHTIDKIETEILLPNFKKKDNDYYQKLRSAVESKEKKIENLKEKVTNQIEDMKKDIEELELEQDALISSYDIDEKLEEKLQKELDEKINNNSGLKSLGYYWFDGKGRGNYGKRQPV